MAFSSVPSRLGPLVVRNVLCTTGAGALLRVEDPYGGRPQTVLLLDPEQPAWPRRLRDRRLLPAHPRLCALSSSAPAIAQQDDRVFYYVGAESLCGWTALDEIDRDGAILPLRRALRLCAETADALACAHAVGLHHGHLEPGCLFIQTFAEEDEGHVKLLGAGLDVIAGPYSRAARYRAPDADPSGSSAELAAADVYALGAVLYHMVTGRVPDAAEPANPANPDRSPAGLRADPLLSLRPLLARALHADAARRFPSAAALRDALLDVEVPRESLLPPVAAMGFRATVALA